jgi:hypothetical protein
VLTDVDVSRPRLRYSDYSSRHWLSSGAETADDEAGAISHDVSMSRHNQTGVSAWVGAAEQWISGNPVMGAFGKALERMKDIVRPLSVTASQPAGGVRGCALISSVSGGDIAMNPG